MSNKRRYLTVYSLEPPPYFYIDVFYCCSQSEYYCGLKNSLI